MTRRICSLALVALGLVGLFVYVYGALLLGGQAYYWLRSGVWVPLPTTALVLETPLAKDTANNVASDQAGASVSVSAGAPLVPESSWAIFRRYIPRVEAPAVEAWLRNPTSWFGLHQATTGTLGLLSLPFTAIVLGLVLAGTAMGIWLELRSTKTTSEG